MEEKTSLDQISAAWCAGIHTGRSSDAKRLRNARADADIIPRPYRHVGAGFCGDFTARPYYSDVKTIPHPHGDRNRNCDAY